MNNTSDFVIRDGILLEYWGTGGTVVVPAGVRGIRSRVFMASRVEEVVLPEGLQWLGDSVFAGCELLRRLVLPDSLETIPVAMCRGCKALREIRIPAGVRFLGESAFHSSGLQAIRIPDSVEGIGDMCFRNCPDLEEVSFGAGLRLLGKSAFHLCRSLRSLSLPDALRSVPDNAFAQCDRLESVRLGRGVERLGNAAFRQCVRLREVEGSALRRFSGAAFPECFALRRLALPGRGVELEWAESPALAPPPLPAGIIRAPWLRPERTPPALRPAVLAGFREMRAQGAPLSPEVAEAWEAFAAGAEPVSSGNPAEPFTIVDGILYRAACPEGRVVVPEGVLGIRVEAFQGTYIREIVLPDSVEWIQDSAFQDCRFLQSVRLPRGLTSIPESLFARCESLRSLAIPEGVVAIQSGAFCQTALERVQLPPALKTIGPYAFSACVRLNEVRFPDGLREILEGAFERCGSLESVRLPDSLAVLRENAFTNCSSLERVRFGASLTELPSRAFRDCPRLNALSIPANLRILRSRAVSGWEGTFRLVLEGSFTELHFRPARPMKIVARQADPTILEKDCLRALLLGFAAENGEGYRFEREYLELLRNHRKELWDSPEVLRCLLDRGLLEREDLNPVLTRMQELGRPDLVAEVLEYGHRRFPEPKPVELL